MEILIIIALIFLVYAKTINFQLVVDDIRRSKEVIEGILDDKTISWPEIIRRRLYGIGTLARKGKINLKHEHFLTVCIHSLICVLIYKAFGSNEISLWASILYALNPANNQTSIWLNGRRYAINCTLVLGILTIGPIGLILYPLACLLQVNAIFAPILFGWWGVLAFPIFYLVAGPQTIERVKERFSSGRIDSPDLTTITLKKLIPAIKTYGLYCLKMILPERTMMCYSHLFYWGMTAEGNKDAYAIDKKFLGGVIAIALTIASGVYFWGKPQFFMLLFMFASIFQWCGLISVTQMFTDRYISLANTFMMYFVAYFAYQFLGANAISVLTALCAYYYANLQVTMTMYKNLESFWNYHLYFNPSDPKCPEFKASTLLKQGDPIGAWGVVKEALRHNPNDYKLNLLAANCMECFQDHKSVLLYMNIAKKNCYFGKEFLLKDLQRKIFKFDLDEELRKIEEKTSRFTTKERENIKAIGALVNR